MREQICRQLRGAPSSAGAKQNVMVSSGTGIFASENSGLSTARQRIIDLYADLRPSLHAYLCTLGVRPDQAEDVIQETFLRLVRYRFEQSTHDNLRAWLFRVAHNLSMDVHRFHRRWSPYATEETHTIVQHRVDPGPSPEQQLILDERMRQFENAFAQLTPKQRQCVLLRAEGFRYREIALALGVSVQRVGELVQRSISVLELHTS